MFVRVLHSPHPQLDRRLDQWFSHGQKTMRFRIVGRKRIACIAKALGVIGAEREEPIAEVGETNSVGDSESPKHRPRRSDAAPCVGGRRRRRVTRRPGSDGLARSESRSRVPLDGATDLRRCGFRIRNRYQFSERERDIVPRLEKQNRSSRKSLETSTRFHGTSRSAEKAFEQKEASQGHASEENVSTVFTGSCQCTQARVRTTVLSRRQPRLGEVELAKLSEVLVAKFAPEHDRRFEVGDRRVRLAKKRGNDTLSVADEELESFPTVVTQKICCALDLLMRLASSSALRCDHRQVARDLDRSTSLSRGHEQPFCAAKKRRAERMSPSWFITTPRLFKIASRTATWPLPSTR